MTEKAKGPFGKAMLMRHVRDLEDRLAFARKLLEKFYPNKYKPGSRTRCPKMLPKSIRFLVGEAGRQCTKAVDKKTMKHPGKCRFIDSNGKAIFRKIGK